MSQNQSGQHFLLSTTARTLSLAKVMRLSDQEAFATFKALRWASTAPNLRETSSSAAPAAREAASSETSSLIDKIRYPRISWICGSFGPKLMRRR